MPRPELSRRCHILPAVFCLVALLALTGRVRGDTPSTEADTADPSGFRLMPPQYRSGGLVTFPKVGYSSETSFTGGGILRYALPWSGLKRSVLSLRLKGTLEGHSEVEFIADMRFGDGRRGIKTKLSRVNLPLYFYGIGPRSSASDEETYKPEDVLAYIEIFQRVVPNLRVGLRTEYEAFELEKLEEGGLLDTQPIRGTEERSIHGGGLVVDWDTRDRGASPTSGSYYQAFALFFGKPLGGEYEFNNYNVDLRNYFSLGGEHVLATQLFAYAVRGAPPFWRLAALGGRHHSRGYRKGRFLDRVLLSAQLEYRFPVWRRVGMVAFGGLADVASAFDRLQFVTVRPTVGGGLRYALGAEDGLKARFDAAFGGDTPRFYLSLDEAF